MARNRSADIARAERDLRRCENAARLVGNMVGNNNTVTLDLTDLDVAYEYSVKIPQADFKAKMLELNEKIGPALSSINTKIMELVEKLNEYLREAREEQERWEEEQRQAQANSENISKMVDL